MVPLKAGSSRAAITPRVRTPLGGNARVNNYATGVLQDLFARALWLHADGQSTCIISLDLLGLWEHRATPLREAVAAATGISPEKVMIACTHTHSGPDTVGMMTWSEEKHRRDRELLAPWWEMLTERVVQAAVSAKDCAIPVTVHVQMTENPDIAHNRRLRLKSGETVMNWTMPPPDDVAEVLGPVDPQVTVLSFRAGEKLQGALVHFTCHPAILAGLNLNISGDYCGMAMEELEKQFFPGGTAAFLFLNGAMGNVNHIDYLHPERGRDLGEVRRCALSLEESVREAMSEESAAVDDAKLQCVFRELLLPIRAPDPEKVKAARAILDSYDGRDLSLADGVPPQIIAQRIVGFEEAWRTGKYPGPSTTLRDKKVVFPIQVFRIGELTIATIPSELFVEYGLRYKELLKSKTALIATVTNGYSGYIPTPEAFMQGGYEPTMGPSYLPEDAGEQILQEIVDMAAQ